MSSSANLASDSADLAFCPADLVSCPTHFASGSADLEAGSADLEAGSAHLDLAPIGPTPGCSNHPTPARAGLAPGSTGPVQEVYLQLAGRSPGLAGRFLGLPFHPPGPARLAPGSCTCSIGSIGYLQQVDLQLLP